MQSYSAPNVWLTLSDKNCSTVHIVRHHSEYSIRRIWYMRVHPAWIQLSEYYPSDSMHCIERPNKQNRFERHIIAANQKSWLKIKSSNVNVLSVCMVGSFLALPVVQYSLFGVILSNSIFWSHPTLCNQHREISFTHQGKMVIVVRWSNSQRFASSYLGDGWLQLSSLLFIILRFLWFLKPWV